MGNDNATSETDNAESLSPYSEPERLQNVNAMKIWFDLNDITQQCDYLGGLTDISELNKRLDWKSVYTLQDLSIKQRAERHQVRVQVELARKSPDAVGGPDIGASLRSSCC